MQQQDDESDFSEEEILFVPKRDAFIGTVNVNTSTPALKRGGSEHAQQVRDTATTHINVKATSLTRNGEHIEVKVTENSSSASAALSSFRFEELKAALPPIIRVSRKRKILAVLDLNGILFFREKIEQTPANCIPRPNAQVGTFNVWDRKHANSFIDFMFSLFDVGVWSSARKENVMPLVARAFGKDRQDKLLFIWDQSYCTVEKRKHRPLFCKELRKVWDKYPQYADGSTILIDDDEEKAKHNPDYTAIHPKEWTRHLPDDEELAPDGRIRQYLEALSLELENNDELKVEDFIRLFPFASVKNVGES